MPNSFKEENKIIRFDKNDVQNFNSDFGRGVVNIQLNK